MDHGVGMLTNKELNPEGNLGISYTALRRKHYESSLAQGNVRGDYWDQWCHCIGQIRRVLNLSKISVCW